MHRKAEDFIALLKPVYSNGVKYCLALTKNEAEAKDLFQDSLLRAMEHFNALKEETKFKSWLFTIITREFYALHRKSILRKLFIKKLAIETTELPVTFLVENPDPRLPALLQALNHLNEKERAALVLFEVEGFSMEEIRKIQGEQSLSAVKSRLSRARTKLRALMTEKNIKTLSK